MSPTEDLTLVLTREHRNGHIAEVLRQPDGTFKGQERRPSEPEREGQFIGDLESLHLAQSVADALAHVGCNGRGCGDWVKVE
jgi:hypothetical protein